MGCGASQEEKKPEKPKTQAEYKAERLKVRAAIRERIMKPLQEFRFATAEKDWKQMPGVPKLEVKSEVTLHGTYETTYCQPPQQSDDDVRDALTKFDYYGPTSAKSGIGGASSEKNTHVSANSNMSGAVSAISSNSWKSKKTNTSGGQSNDDGGESPSVESINSCSSSTGPTKVTKSQVYASRNSILDRDLHSNGVRVIEHRQSLARFSRVSSENMSGVTMSKRHTMSMDEYQSIEAIPGQVLKASAGEIEGNLETTFSKMQEERRAEEEEYRRHSVATGRGSIVSFRPQSVMSSKTNKSAGGASHMSGRPDPNSASEVLVSDVWDEEMDAEDQETLALLMGDPNYQPPQHPSASKSNSAMQKNPQHQALTGYIAPFGASSSDGDVNNAASASDRSPGGHSPTSFRSSNQQLTARTEDGIVSPTSQVGGTGGPGNDPTPPGADSDKYIQNQREADIHDLDSIEA